MVGADSALSFGIDQNERCYIFVEEGPEMVRGLPTPSSAPAHTPPRPPQNEDCEILWSSMKDCFLVGSA